MYSLRYASSFLNVPKKVSATAFSPAGRFLLEYDSFWPYVKPPMWCFYSTPHRRFTQNLGWSLISLATSFLCFASKTHRALILLLLASEPDSLRWIPVRVGANRTLLPRKCSRFPSRRKRQIACGSFMYRTPGKALLLARQNAYVNKMRKRDREKCRNF